MIPWIESQVFYLGAVPLRTWGTFVAFGFLIATWVAARRAVQNKLDPKVVWDLAFWLLVSAFIGARLFHVLAYDPAYYFAHPGAVLDPREPGFAIYGGFLACVLAFFGYIKRKQLDFLAYADTLIWGVPWGCGIGRIGCFLIHDHPGTLSSFVLTVNYPDGKSRHDLGLYLSITGFAIALIFLILNRKARGPGFWFGAFIVLDGISRFWLDFYRVADVTYLHLTPTQWLTIPLVGVGGWLVVRVRAGA